MPFLENVTRGRGIPRSGSKRSAEHYFDRRRAQPDQRPVPRPDRRDPRRTSPSTASTLPVYWGNRNWDPYLTDTLRRMRADGIRRAACLRDERLRVVLRLPAVPREPVRRRGRPPRRAPRRQAAALLQPPRLRRRRSSTDAARRSTSSPRRTRREAARSSSSPTRSRPRWPQSAGPEGGAYVAQHRAVAAAGRRRVPRRTGVDRAVGACLLQPLRPPQSRGWSRTSTTTSSSWREPGRPAVVIVPIGFVSDHMEVVYDLDTEAARDRRPSSAWHFARAATPGVHPSFVARRPRPARRAGRRRAGRTRRARVRRRARRRPGTSAGRTAAPTRGATAAVSQHSVRGTGVPCMTERTASCSTSARHRGARGGRPGRRGRRASASRSPTRSPARPTSSPPSTSRRSELIRARIAGRAPGRRLPRRGGRRHRTGTSGVTLGRRPHRRHCQLPLRHPAVRGLDRRRARRAEVVVARRARPDIGRDVHGGSGRWRLARRRADLQCPTSPTSARPWSAPASTTGPTSAPTRPPSWPGCCRASATSGGWARPRSTSATSPADGSTRTSSAASSPGTSPRPAVVEEAGGRVEGLHGDAAGRAAHDRGPGGLLDAFHAELVACGFGDWPMPDGRRHPDRSTRPGNSRLPRIARDTCVAPRLEPARST